MLLRSFPLIILAAGALACSSDTTDDLSTSVDTGFPDAGETDSGVVPDSGVDTDAGLDPDSGVAEDTGTGPSCPESYAPSGTPTCAPIGTELQAGTAPIRRGDMAYAVDQACGRVFMFYGDRAEPMMCGPAASQFINDGYMFEPSTGRWYSLTPAAGAAPRNRVRASGAWDSMRNRFILFGGRFRQGAAGAYIYQKDVWAYDPATNAWTELWAQTAAGGPTGRMNTVMVADPDGDRILLFGGGQVSSDAQSFIVDDQTWAFDLATNTWTQLATAGTKPTARLFHTGAFDKTNRKFYVFGGGGADAFTSPTFFQDLWALDVQAGTWARMTPAGATPDGRIKGEMDYDQARNRLVLFAGHNDQNLGNDNELWSFELGTEAWTQNVVGDTFNAPAIGFCDFPAKFAIVDQCQPERRESHLFRIFGDQAFLYGGRTDCGLTNDTWMMDLRNNTWRQVNPSFNGMTCYRSGRTDCDDANARKCG